MSDYSQGITFGDKDNLPSGTPQKRILGAEVDSEFVAIASAISSKLDKFSTLPQEAPDQTNDVAVFYDVTDQQYKKTTINSLSTPTLTGSIIAYAGTTTPSGYLECNGANVSRTIYAALFNAVGVTWGAGDGTSTFTLPDLRRRTMIGKNGTASTGSPGITVGSTGGAETKTLAQAELPSHYHLSFNNDSTTSSMSSSSYPSHIGNLNPIDYAYYIGGSATVPSIGRTSSIGSGTAFNLMQPTAVVGYFIKI